MKNIVLTGFMGTGKSSISKELSSMLGMKIVEMDAEIEKEQGISINEIFARFGESRFREIETEMARKIAGSAGIIISTGGGIVLRKENMDYLRANGIIVCLTASAETMLRRTGSSDDRPLLKVPDPLGKIRELLEIRKPFYLDADLVVDTDGKSPRRVAGEIIERTSWKE